MKNQKESERFTMMIRKAGLKATKARISILEALNMAPSPLTADETISTLKKNAPDQATVYRALKELKSAGLIRKVDFQHGHAHYELADSVEHHHIICTTCEKTEDFVGCNFQSIIKTAMRQSKDFRSITQHSLELFGICRSCARKRM